LKLPCGESCKKQDGQWKKAEELNEGVEIEVYLYETYDVPITLSKLCAMPSFQINSLPQCQCWAHVADLWLGGVFQLSRTCGIMN
jgi:hypothetical protein